MQIKTKRNTLIRKESASKDGCLYEYMLYVKESPNVASFRLPLYSIKVRLTLKCGKVSEYEAQEIFKDSKRAIAFFEMLIENLVTPLNLPYVIEDELLQY